METSYDVQLSQWVAEQIDFTVNQVRKNTKTFDTLVPPAASEQLVYRPEANHDWTASFWTGILFLSKELTGSTEFDETIEKQLHSFQERLDQRIGLETHDIGFCIV